jgi:hypothetical protein
MEVNFSFSISLVGWFHDNQAAEGTLFLYGGALSGEALEWYLTVTVGKDITDLERVIKCEWPKFVL